jgi:hypothetical protein
MGPSDHGLFDAPVLIAQSDLKVEDGLSVTLEAEVAGLDDPRVDGAYGDLVDLRPFHAEEVCYARLWILPHVTAFHPGFMETYGFEPRVTFRKNAELLRHFAFEEMRLPTAWRQGREARRVQFRPSCEKSASLVICKYGDELELLVGTEAGQAQASLADLITELREGELRHVLQRQRSPIADRDELLGTHG